MIIPVAGTACVQRQVDIGFESVPGITTYGCWAHASAEVRCRVRQQEAGPVLEALKLWLEANGGLPRSVWGQAVRYTLTRWPKLVRYLEDGRIEIDNNAVERAIRPIAVGRKNYLFAGSHAAAQRATVLYSLLGTCKLHGINPQDWVSNVLRRIPTQPNKRISDLLPHRWQGQP